jgi:hypothetical protein
MNVHKVFTEFKTNLNLNMKQFFKERCLFQVRLLLLLLLLLFNLELYKFKQQ